MTGICILSGINIPPVISIGVVINVILLILSRIVSNERIHGVGVSLGKALDRFGTLKLGVAWEKVEDFIENSGTQFFTGFKVGLNDGEDNTPKEDPKSNVRI